LVVSSRWRARTPNGYIVSLTTALNRTRTLQVERLPTGDTRRTDTNPNGARTVLLVSTNGASSLTQPDGTVINRRLGPDPRWGMQAPIMSQQVQTLPSGLSQTTTLQRA
jgi:hypothetical protein